MKLGNLDAVVVLGNYRRKALEAFEAAGSGMIDVRLAYEGNYADLFSIICADPIRAAIRKELSDYIKELDQKLADFGVEP